MTEVKLLEDELRRIGGLIERAALAEDFKGWARLAMRRDALPSLVREARAQPVRREIEGLEEELEVLEEQRQRVLDEEPTVPAGMRGHVTPSMVRNRLLGGVSNQASAVGKELDEARRRLASIEAEGVTTLY